ncbi:MAG: flagellar basal-body MS-ring/collar protein FliF [Acidobacteriota bacterium]|nr:flagellar basal-body MS-ring/collar protein FliF [Acidobacteriota bacterium]
MAVNADQIINQIVTFVKGLTLRQKITIAVGAAAVAGTVWVFVALFGKADYKTLYSGLSSSDAQALSHRLSEKNIPYELTSDGTGISVPADQLDKVRLDLASEGMPQSGRLGFELFDKPNWAGSDFAEKVNYQRALEGELERTIQTLGDVEAARVHLVLPQESLFTEQEHEAKASVVIKLRAGKLGDDAQEAITHLVASAVDNLKPENVTLINADGGMPILARGGTESRPRSWADFETSLARKVVATLEPVVGPGKARANVTVEYDMATSDSMQETYDPNGAVVLTSQISTESVGETGAQGTPGTTSNVPGKQPAPAAKPAAPADAEPQGLHSENKTFAVSKTVRHTTLPSGNLKRITAAVLVDDATDTKEENGQKVETRRKRTPDEMKQIGDLVAAAIGIDATRGDKVAVENLSFQVLPLELPAPTLTERVVPIVDKWINVIRYGALILLFLLIYMLVLRPIKRQIVTTFQELPKQLGVAKVARVALPGSPSGGAAVKSEDASALEASMSQLGDSPMETKQAVMLKKNLLEKVKKEPAAASRLIQNWMRQEGKS